ncbi:hypothetical protein N9215_01445 [Akkermansiaceae bacterium]|nr:hypothetical protein [Akkermansiaceae bacterium]MDB4500310.1 hypothetical protein [Akkermansiaceae bacterium]
MKTSVTHLLAVAIGVVAALLLRPAIDEEKISPVETRESKRVERGMANSITPFNLWKRAKGKPPGCQLVTFLTLTCVTICFVHGDGNDNAPSTLLLSPPLK